MNKFLGIIRWSTLSLFALGIGPLLITAASLIYFSSDAKIMPGVQVGGVPVGGLARAEAEAELDRLWNGEYRLTAVDLQDPARAWVVRPSEFGLRVDLAASTDEALGLIRSGDLLDRTARMLSVLRSGVDLRPVVTFDPVTAQAGFAHYEPSLASSPQDAGITLENGEIVVDPAQNGWRLDVLASIELLAESPASFLLEHRMIPFVMQPVEASRTDVSPVVEWIERLIENAPALQAYDPVTDEHLNWPVDRVELTNWIVLHVGEDKIDVDFDPQAVSQFVSLANLDLGSERNMDTERGRDSLLAQLAGGEGELIIVEYQPTTYQVQSGDQWISLSFKVGMPYWKLQEVNPALARRGLIPGETLVLPPRDDMLTLPVVPAKRIMVDISEQRMRVYEDGALIRENVISTGIPDSPTMPGIFQISSHFLNAYASIWNLYMPHFMGIYDAVPGLTNGIHGLPMLSSGRRLWADVLGRPASFGCIILDLQAAEELYNWAEDGVVVVIEE